MRCFIVREVVIFGALILLVMWGIKANATVSIFSTCPDKFIGNVSKVSDVEAPSSLSMINVKFEILHVLKGTVSESKSFKILKNGPLVFKRNNVYKISSRGKWICSVSKF